jgi:hypothetical protein
MCFEDVHRYLPTAWVSTKYRSAMEYGAEATEEFYK